MNTETITLPSGSTICEETWAMCVQAGQWAAILEPNMYSERDWKYMDAMLGVTA